MLSAVAPRTRDLAMLVEGTPARVFDTSKTIPGLRDAQKYAVKVGGGDNHRIGLFDQILIKENHIASAGSITQAIQAARQMHPTIKVQVEVETFVELEEAFNAQPDIIILDNFDINALEEAVQQLANAGLQHIELEALKVITEEYLSAIGATSVERISLGTLT